MFERGTVFIVGAGASCELGLPSGPQLMGNIISLLHIERMDLVDSEMKRAVVEIAKARAHNWGDEYQKLIAATQRVARALPFALSIDNLLDAHCHDEDLVKIGKISICRAILLAEQKSYLRSFIVPDQPNRLAQQVANDAAKFKLSWYPALMQLLNAGLPLAELKRIFENVSFITFNYDRCLEFFLLNGIIRYYGVDENEALEVMKTLKIVHIYGQVGSLPGMGQPVSIGFGDADNQGLLEVASRIQTFTEAADSALVQRAQSMIRNAETVVFMGFGFLPQNVEILKVKDTNVTRVFMTTYGFSDSDVQLVADEMVRILGKARAPDNVPWNGKTYALFDERGKCADLLRNHWVRLTHP